MSLKNKNNYYIHFCRYATVAILNHVKVNWVMCKVFFDILENYQILVTTWWLLKYITVLRNADFDKNTDASKTKSVG